MCIVQAEADKGEAEAKVEELRDDLFRLRTGVAGRMCWLFWLWGLGQPPCMLELGQGL